MNWEERKKNDAKKLQKLRDERKEKIIEDIIITENSAKEAKRSKNQKKR